MVQGTASHAGKSLLCAALCRIFRQDGHRVAPFKAQNMALNSCVTRDGGEIGRAQGVQAEAAGIEATVDMNPVLLKPKHDMVAEVIMRGRSVGDCSAAGYRNGYLVRAAAVVAASLARLRAEFDVVVMEGAGSPAEVNLKDRDLANMWAAALADAPVLLLADIDRGGVFAAVVGTLDLLDPEERGRVAGIIINKFRGDRDLLTPGLEFLEKRTGKPVLGVIPFIPGLRLAAEDSVDLDDWARIGRLPGADAAIDIAVIRLPRISNFTDLDPLAAEAGVGVRYVAHPADLGEPDAIIIPGTRSTALDLLFLHESGLAAAVAARAGRGTPLVGICGGYQMLGRAVLDPHGAESDRSAVPGLGLLGHTTVFAAEKVTVRVAAEVAAGAGFLSEVMGTEVRGYEIHLGRTAQGEGDLPLFRVRRREGQAQPGEFDGSVSHDGAVFGTYLHGIFDNDRFRRAWLGWLHRRKGLPPLDAHRGLRAAAAREGQYDLLARVVRENLDLPAVYRLMGLDLETR